MLNISNLYPIQINIVGSLHVYFIFIDFILDYITPLLSSKCSDLTIWLGDVTMPHALVSIM